MDPETITLGEVSQIETKISPDTIYMLNLKNMIQMNLFTKPERDSQTQKTSWSRGAIAFSK